MCRLKLKLSLKADAHAKIKSLIKFFNEPDRRAADYIEKENKSRRGRTTNNNGRLEKSRKVVQMLLFSTRNVF
jgi:hypothetical protein